MSLKDKNILFYGAAALLCFSVIIFRKVSKPLPLVELYNPAQTEALYKEKINHEYTFLHKAYSLDLYESQRVRIARRLKESVDSICDRIHHPAPAPDEAMNDLIIRTKTYMKMLSDSIEGINEKAIDNALAGIEKPEARDIRIPSIPKWEVLEQSRRCLRWYVCVLDLYSYIHHSGFPCRDSWARIIDSPESYYLLQGDTFRTRTTAILEISRYSLYDIKTTINGQYYPSYHGIIKWTAPPQKPGKYYYTVHTTAKVWDTDSIIENKARFYYLVR